MKRLASVLLGTVLLVGAVVPASALAESPATAGAGKGKVQVINLRGEDIGPATYRETKTFKPDKKTTVVQSGVVTTTVSAVTTAKKQPGWYETSNTLSRRSWLQIWCYSLTVIGDYHTDGQYIDEYGETDYAVSTNIMWSSASERSSWAVKSKTSGKARASAIFKSEIPTPWGGIQIRQVSESVTASARP